MESVQQVIRWTVLFVLGCINVGAIVLALLAVRNIGRWHRDARGEYLRRQRIRERSNAAKSDPLGIFTAIEMKKLSITPVDSTVNGTRLFRRATPDPWARGFRPGQHHLAVHATRLKEMADIGGIVAGIISIVGGAIIGVAVTEFVSAGGKRADGPLVLLGVAVLIVFFALMFQAVVLRDWRNAAERYRALARFEPTRRRAQRALSRRAGRCGRSGKRLQK